MADNKGILNEDSDLAPVLIVFDGRYLVHAGDPSSMNKKLLGEYAQKGYKIKTITIKQYREKINTWKWIYDKPKRKQFANTQTPNTNGDK